MTRTNSKTGYAFDGSSIRGFQTINESDMLLMPDPTSVFMDPFTEVPTGVVICDITDPLTGQRYGKDPATPPRRRSSI